MNTTKWAGWEKIKNMGIGEFSQVLQEEKTLQNILGWTDEELEDLYSCLKDINGECRWDEAIDAASFLLAINPFLGPVYVEAGFAYQNKGCLTEAITLYSLGAIHSLGSPEPYLYLVSCYHVLGETGKAIESLKQAILVIEEMDYLGKWQTLLPDLQKTLKVIQGKHGKYFT